MIDLLIPCFNEDKNVESLVKQWSKILKIDRRIHVSFINNGSSDGTYSLLNEYINTLNDSNMKIVNIQTNRGYGYGLKMGLEKTNHKYVAWTHADLQVASEDVLKLIDNYLESNNKDELLMMGRRQKRTLVDKFFTSMMSIFTFFVTGYLLFDINSQPKIFPRNLLENLDELPNDFNLDLGLLLIAKKNKFEIKLKDLVFYKRISNSPKGGGSFIGKIKLSLSTLKYLVRYFFKRF